MTTLTIAKTAPPAWLLAFWKEIDTRASVKVSTALWRMLRVASASLNGMDASRSVRVCARFIDTGFTAHHDFTEYWDGGPESRSFAALSK